MEYEKIWKKILTPDEEVKFEFTIGKLYCILAAILWTIFGALTIHIYGLGIFVTIIAWVYYGWYVKRANAFAFTNKRVLVHRGIIATHLISVDFNKITDVQVKESLLEKIFAKTGNLIINTAGTPFNEIILEHVEMPYEIKKKLDSLRG